MTTLQAFNGLDAETGNSLNRLLERQKSAYLAHPMPSAEERIAGLLSLKKSLLKNKEHLCEALSRDFGYRSTHDSLMADVLPCVQAIGYHVRHIRKWMRPQRRSAGLLFSPAGVRVFYQPLGVVGVVVPWNFPVMLSLGPLISAFAAGNRVMIKMSEYTPETNQVLARILGKVFYEDEVAVVEGDAKVAASFSSLPFDHLLFTGSTFVGRLVMEAAAKNLTPVTLELGGKSPVLIAPDMDIDTAVERMIYGKCLNAGQICVAPDYVLVPKARQEAFVAAYKKRFDTLYPAGVDSPDYTSIINRAQYQRLLNNLEDARNLGARVVPCGEKVRDDVRRRLTTHLILDVTQGMLIATDEIFGPLFPVIPYDEVDDAIRYIGSRPRPLALYLMTFDRALERRVMSETHAGGMAINDTALHVALDDAPFGGIGPSGMGHYHGREGFLTFSKAKTVFRKGRFNSGKFMHPPYGRKIQEWILKLFLR